MSPYSETVLENGKHLCSTAFSMQKGESMGRKEGWGGGSWTEGKEGGKEGKKEGKGGGSEEQTRQEGAR